MKKLILLIILLALCVCSVVAAYSPGNVTPIFQDKD
jgi:hypothetical protein